MHETHLIEPVIRNIEAHAKNEGASRVTRVGLKVGLFLGLQEAPLRETFQVLSKGSMLAGAALEITFFPGERIEVISFDIE